MKRIIYLFAILVFGINVLAQETTTEATEEKKEETQEFKISAEIRPRMEYYHGYKTLAAPDQDHGLSISQRTRLIMDFNNSNFIVKLSLQDVRIWGDQNQLVANEDMSASVHEAWGEAIISPVISLKVGRQEIIYDDHRIFGNVGWAQQARSHDAAIFKLKSAKFKAELGIAYNQDAANLSGTDNQYRPNNYKAFQNLWMNYKFSEQFNASFLFLNNGMQIETGGDAYSQTIGPRLSFKNDAISANAAFYYQGGVDRTVTDVKASYLGADVSYKFNDMFSAGVGIERLSGNSQLDNNGENNSFTPLYGTNHKFNGHMDYFYVGNHANSVGLQDIFVKLNAKAKKFSVGLHTHFFSSAGDVADPVDGSAMSKGLGTEIDLFFGFNLTKGVAFKGGYSQMFATETMEVVKGSVPGSKDEANNWGYAMIIFKPELFSHKK
jgi:hypothetical protein